MRAFITTSGDWNVGMPGDEVVVDFISISFAGNEFLREGYRDELQNFFTELLDSGAASVHFDDECPDCHSTTKTSGCPSCMEEYNDRAD